MEQVSEKLPESVVSLLPRLVARSVQRGPAVPGRAEPAGGAPPHLHRRHLLQVQEVIQQEVFPFTKWYSTINKTTLQLKDEYGS